ncbi:MAG: hypothetical protein RLO52_37875 [Sandaracinaceae bacterium]
MKHWLPLVLLAALTLGGCGSLLREIFPSDEPARSVVVNCNEAGGEAAAADAVDDAP